MSAVTAIPVPKSDKELAVFYRQKWKDRQDIIETKNERIEQLNNQVTESNNQVTESNKAIKYLLWCLSNASSPTPYDLNVIG